MGSKDFKPKQLSLTIKSFAKELENKFNPWQVIINKQNTKYIFNYLTNKLGAQFILIEENYFSQSYFEDYKFYHINSYHDYNKTCKRMHFFKKKAPINIENTFDFYLNPSKKPEIEEYWNESYLGYIVIRPLPSGIIGATLLKPIYTSDEHYEINLPVTTQEEINLYGRKIANFNCLIYQEQDKIVGACATASLWSILDRCSTIFHNPTFSPARLTEMAEKFHRTNVSQRQFPNSTGLNLFQITGMLNKINLEYEIRTPVFDTKCKRFIGAYLTKGFPILLGVEFRGQRGLPGELHTIAMLGRIEPKDKIILYKFNNLKIKNLNSKSNITSDNIVYKSDLIDSYIIHDDQLGPYNEIKIENDIKSIDIGWENESDKTVSIHSLLSVIHPTWTISTSTIEQIIKTINNSILNLLNFELENKYWDYYVCKSNEWKYSLSNDGQPVLNSEIIFSSLPQYVWVIDLYRIHSDAKGHRSVKVFSILIDITSLSKITNIIGCIIHDELFQIFKEKNKELIQGKRNNFISILKEFGSLENLTELSKLISVAYKEPEWENEFDAVPTISNFLSILKQKIYLYNVIFFNSTEIVTH